MAQDLSHKLTLVVLGRSGSGKGTQARFLVERLKKYGVHHMETGRFIRELIASYHNPSTEIAHTVMVHGELHPSWFAAYGWLKEFIEEGCGAEHLVFDGACRRLWEAKLLDDVMVWHRRPLPLCIYIDLGRAEAKKRLLGRGRADDTASTIDSRLNYFPKDVVPVLRYYAHHGRLIRVNGKPAPAIVAKEIDTALRKRLGKQWPSPLKQGKK